MRVLVWVLVSIAVLVAIVAALVVWNPVLVSRIVWPIVEDRQLDEPFLGVTARGALEPNLFSIEATGVSTAPVVAAASTFLATLDAGQRERTLYPVDDLEWRRWANIHIATRQGVGFLEMTEPQRNAGFALLRASLSARGFQTARDIMRLEGHLADLLDDHHAYGEQRYWITVMGEPSLTQPWGWQIDGHHLVINYFVLGDQVVMTPTFMGSEPVRADSGPYAGTAILDAELEAGLALVNALDPGQRADAILTDAKTANSNRGELFQDNAVVPYEGLTLDRLSPAQKALATNLISLYVGKLSGGHADVKMTDILAHWDATRFAWVGGTAPDSVFYYRIHSPVLLIEYDHQTPVALEGPDRPTREHVHTVVRTPNGNDYGKDLLRQHLLRRPHAGSARFGG